MKFFRYWYKVENKESSDPDYSLRVTVYGRSNDSIEDAKNNGIKRLAEIEDDAWEYQEGDDSIREEVLQVIDDKNVITRNRYGAKILNTEQLLILDLDLVGYRYPDRNAFLSFLGLIPKGLEAMLNSVRTIAEKKYPQLGFRIYQTKGGLRIFVLGQPFSLDREVLQLMKDFGTDSLYQQLCRKQNCCRARLTAKPPYLRMRSCQIQYPCPPERETKQQTWIAEYEERRQPFATCRYLETVGYSPKSLPEIITFHDEQTQASSNLPLA